MFKNILLAVMFIALVLMYGMNKLDESGGVYGCHEEKMPVDVIMDCAKKGAYKQNEMVNGCVMQKSGNQWIRTCG